MVAAFIKKKCPAQYALCGCGNTFFSLRFLHVNVSHLSIIAILVLFFTFSLNGK